MEVSREKLARYPFTSEAAEYIKARGLFLSDFEKPEFQVVVERAEERIREALEKGVVNYRGDVVADVEILSFPLALALVNSIQDNFLKHRYALAESERARRILANEEPRVVLEVARDALGWKARFVGSKLMYDYALDLGSYLEVASVFHHERWKLVNRPVKDGYVYLTGREFTRLIAEGVKGIIEDEIEASPRGRLPPKLEEVADRIRRLLSEKRPASEVTEVVKGRVVVEAFPPCIKSFYQALLKGEHLPHVARFAITSFLLNIGVEVEEVVKLFTRMPDANERITRYQVEHIAGLRGSKTKYTPPKCETLKTHGLCVEGGRFCGRVKHPLTYYRRALRRFGRVGEREKPELSEEPVQEVL